MDIRRIRNFIAVVNVGSIARAAASAHMAQSALSTQMRQLEETVGNPLLVRSVKGVTPTALGVEFYKKGLQLLIMADELAEIGQNLSTELVGRVSIGCPASVGKMLSIPLLEVTLARYPKIQIEILESTSTGLGHLLIDGHIDIAVLFTDNITRDMHHEVVLQEDLFAVGKDLPGPEIQLSSLAGIGLIIPSKPNSVRIILEKAFSQIGLSPKVLADISSPHTMLELARRGLGTTVVPWSMLGSNITDDLSVSRIVSPRLTRTIAIATGERSQGVNRIVSVRNLIRQTLRELVRESQWKGVRLIRPKID